MSAENFEPDYKDVAYVRPAPNVNERVGGPADMLLIHYTGVVEAEKALKWLCMEASKVSCHYFVFEDGRVVQSVPEKLRGWHAGISSWKGEEDNNSRSIGIEISNPGHEFGYIPFNDVQMEAVIKLSQDICTRNAIPPERVIGHSDVAPSRKQDPGEYFPWDKLFEAGVGHWVPEAPLGDGRFFQIGEEGQPIEALQSMFALYGYGIEVNGIFDRKTQDVVTAFQRHWRQSKVDGVADASTIETLHNLLKSLPVTG